jgi:hypothetical protein
MYRLVFKQTPVSNVANMMQGKIKLSVLLTIIGKGQKIKAKAVESRAASQARI